MQKHKQQQLKRSSRMFTFTYPCYFTVLTLLFSFFTTLSADPNSSFSYQRFDKALNIALYGDAKVVDNVSSVQLTSAVASSTGQLMYKKPFKLLEGKPWKLVSFSTYFEFSLSADNGDGLAFVMVPSGSKAKVFGNSSFGLSLGQDKSTVEAIAVEFDTLRDDKYKDLNGNHVGIDMGSFVSAKAENLSSVNITLGSGEKLHSWIDYQAGSKRLEVRLSKSGSFKPNEPLISYPIDFSKLWKNEEVFVGLSSANGNSSQVCNIYSWSFKLRHVPQWMHSEPVDPKALRKEGKTVEEHKKSDDCLLRVLAALIFGTGCGALGAFVLLYLWTIFGNRRPVVPEEFVMHPKEFEYKKVKVAVDKSIEDGK